MLPRPYPLHISMISKVQPTCTCCLQSLFFLLQERIYCISQRFNLEEVCFHCQLLQVSKAFRYLNLSRSQKIQNIAKERAISINEVGSSFINGSGYITTTGHKGHRSPVIKEVPPTLSLTVSASLTSDILYVRKSLALSMRYCRYSYWYPLDVRNSVNKDEMHNALMITFKETGPLFKQGLRVVKHSNNKRPSCFDIPLDPNAIP